MNSHSAVVIRRAAPADAKPLGQLGGMLLRTHYAFDQQRFMSPGADPEHGYAWFLRSQLDATDSVVLVAERDGEVVGYVYAGLEPQSWKELREACGFVHDVAVEESSRGAGIAEALMLAAIDWLLRIVRLRTVHCAQIPWVEHCERAR